MTFFSAMSSETNITHFIRLYVRDRFGISQHSDHTSHDIINRQPPTLIVTQPPTHRPPGPRTTTQYLHSATE